MSEALPAVEAPPTPPRLRIQHLMIWTAVAAVLLVVGQTRQLQDFYPAVSTVWTVRAVAGQLAASACVTVLALRAWWRRRLGIRFTEPGHAVALLLVISYAFQLPSLMIYAWRFPDGFSPEAWLQLSGYEHALITFGSLAGGFFVGVAVLVIAFRLRQGTAWRVFFFARPALSVAGLLVAPLLMRSLGPTAGGGANFGWFYLAQQWPQLAWLVLLGIACLADEKPRHWTHWWGVLAVIVPTIVSLVSIFVGAATGAFLLS